MFTFCTRQFGFTSIAFLVFVCPLWAQKPVEAGKTAVCSDRPPELSDAEKKKMAEIEQRPEVRDEIAIRWAEVQRRDLDFARMLNSSTRLTDLSAPQFAEFIQNYGQLYDNPILQRYVNNIGQRLVPPNSPNVYAFKLLYDPLPRAEALSTGTILVSTGLISLLDNEAQLAYLLGHEIAHVEYRHAYNEVRDEILQNELNHEKEKSAEKKRTIFSAVAAAAGAAAGGAAGGGSGALIGAGVGLAGGVVASHFIYRTKATITEWSVIDEDDADKAGLQYMLNSNYDVREIPSVYARLGNVVTKDARVGLGFIGKPCRMAERVASVHNLLSDTLKANIDAKLKAGGLVGSTPDFPVLMAALKRDNGILALDYDLFAIARDNLEEAVNLRSNDARAQSYLGKTIALTARTEAERDAASTHFLKAIQYDEARGLYYDSHLERAILLISQNNPANEQEIDKELKTYVALYQRESAGKLPHNIHLIYDYLTLAGDTAWYVPPAIEVSTRYGDSLNVNTSAAPEPSGIQEVVGKTTEKHIAKPPDAVMVPAAQRKKPVTTTQSPTHP
jgi:hypothetical protein